MSWDGRLRGLQVVSERLFDLTRFCSQPVRNIKLFPSSLPRQLAARVYISFLPLPSQNRESTSRAPQLDSPPSGLGRVVLAISRHFCCLLLSFFISSLLDFSLLSISSQWQPLPVRSNPGIRRVWQTPPGMSTPASSLHMSSFIALTRSSLPI